MFYLISFFIFCRPFISSLSFPVLNSAFSAVFLLFLIIWVIVKRAGIHKNLPAGLKLPLILFILSLIVSTIFSQDKTHSLKEFPQYLIGLLLFIIPLSLSPKNKKRVLSAIILAGLGISFLAIYQHFFGFEYILSYLAKEKTPPPGLISYLSQKRAFLPFISPNTLAGYLIMIIPLSLTLKKGIFFILPLGLALCFTKSLGALFSLFLGLTLYFYLNNQKSKNKIALLSGLSAIILLIFFLRLHSGSQFNQPGFSALKRWDYWKETLGIIKLFPFLGVGPRTLNLSQTRYAHNAYLQIWAEMGTFGIAAFFWLITSACGVITKAYQEISYKKEWAGVLTSVITLLIYNLVDFAFFLPEINLTWWLLAGCLLTFKSNNSNSK